MNGMDILRAIFPGLGARPSKRVAHGNKNGSHTRKGPGRYHLQGAVSAVGKGKRS